MNVFQQRYFPFVIIVAVALVVVEDVFIHACFLFCRVCWVVFFFVRVFEKRYDYLEKDLPFRSVLI